MLNAISFTRMVTVFMEVFCNNQTHKNKKKKKKKKKKKFLLVSKAYTCIYFQVNCLIFQFILCLTKNTSIYTLGAKFATKQITFKNMKSVNLRI